MQALQQQLEAVLRDNDRGSHTIPSGHLYPHLWNWDSAFAAIGWAHLDTARAITELETLMAAQWSDGMVPHIAFHAEGDYAPGPDFWGEPAQAPSSVRTSTISQPPVAAWAARIVLDNGGDKTRIAALIPKLEAWHSWWDRCRDPRGKGGICVIHPWESGMDNAPRWDRALGRVQPRDGDWFKRRDVHHADPATRPSDDEYRRYARLVRHIEECGFDQTRAANEAVFAVEDVAITALLHRADAELLQLCDALGIAPGDSRARMQRRKAALHGHLWTDEGFRDYDVLAGRSVAEVGISELIPLVCGAITPMQVEGIEARLRTTYAANAPVPTMPPHDDHYKEHLYWRGPVWLNVNWLIIRGLQLHNKPAAAQSLAVATLRLLEQHGSHEHYSAMTGEPSGARGFTWSAALGLDLLLQT